MIDIVVATLFYAMFQQNYRGLGGAHDKGYCTDVTKSLKSRKIFVSNPSSIFRLRQKYKGIS